MSGETAEVGHNRRLRLPSTPFPGQTPTVSRAGSFVTPTGLLSQPSLGDDGPVSTGAFLCAGIFSVWLPPALLPFFPSSSFHGKILAFTRQIKSTVFINKSKRRPPPIYQSKSSEPTTMLPYSFPDLQTNKVVRSICVRYRIFDGRTFLLTANSDQDLRFGIATEVLTLEVAGSCSCVVGFYLSSRGVHLSDFDISLVADHQSCDNYTMLSLLFRV
ncbi:conserved hypothetical protein [Trichinella spiralis]|uniref:hypothetical protein n=1 Tax=Trichinella spiralis TaxID=6334 RepID=UPI0001EFECC1|nr:conserved hypothetical protein [Trichinella spiralis]